MGILIKAMENHRSELCIPAAMDRSPGVHHAINTGIKLRSLENLWNSYTSCCHLLLGHSGGRWCSWRMRKILRLTTNPYKTNWKLWFPTMFMSISLSTANGHKKSAHVRPNQMAGNLVKHLGPCISPGWQHKSIHLQLGRKQKNELIVLKRHPP